MLHRVNGVLVLYRGAVEAAILPYWVVWSPNRRSLWVGYGPLYMLAAQIAVALYALWWGTCLLLATRYQYDRDEDSYKDQHEQRGDDPGATSAFTH
jgi:hypothetical protein